MLKFEKNIFLLTQILNPTIFTLKNKISLKPIVRCYFSVLYRFGTYSIQNSSYTTNYQVINK